MTGSVQADDGYLFDLPVWVTPHEGNRGEDVVDPAGKEGIVVAIIVNRRELPSLPGFGSVRGIGDAWIFRELRVNRSKEVDPATQFPA